MRKLLACGCLALLGASIPAFAAALSDSLTVFDSAGRIVDRLELYEDGSIICWHVNCAQFQAVPGVTGEDPASVYYFTDVLVNPVNPGVTSVFEGDGSGNFSDIFGIANLPNLGSFLGFLSDNETVAAFGQGVFSVTEDPFLGGTWDATQYLDTGTNSGQVGWTAQFFSDGDSTPEPGTFSLLACGALLAGLRARKLTRS
jgi:hypothetical protein